MKAHPLHGGCHADPLKTGLPFFTSICYNRHIEEKKGFLFIFVFSGAAGNMIDRIRLGYVIDMFDFRLINFPVFNVADIYVTCSMIILLVFILFKYKDNELDDLFGKSKKDSKQE